MNPQIKDDIWLMESTLTLAREAEKVGEVPIAAIVVNDMGQVIGKGTNSKESQNQPCGHAEVNALNDAGEKLNSWRLNGCTLYVNLEPCPMCLNAMIHARVKRLVFGAFDPKGGSLSLGYHFSSDRRLNHRFDIVGGIKHFECSQRLSNFFKARRESYRKSKK